MISGSWHQFKANWMILFWTLPYVFARSSQEMTLCLLRCFREIKCMLLQPGTQNSRKKTLQMWMCCYLDCYVNWNHQRGWWNRDGTPTNSQMVIARTSWTVDIFQRVQWHLFVGLARGSNADGSLQQQTPSSALFFGTFVSSVVTLLIHFLYFQ